WKKDRIGVLDFSTEKTQNAEFEIGPRLTWVYTKGKNIEQAFWMFEASHILFRDGNDTFFIEIEGYGEFKINNILKVREKSSVFYSDDTGDMYYLDSSTGELLLVEIVPVEGVISLPFPEINTEAKDKKIEELWNSGSQEAG
ncbi:MAG: hypothetical protein PVH45_02945, partial [Candidatus Omnitrophota bacterium]